MKKAGEILKEMGFKADAPDSLKEAFVRHLIKAATGVAVEPGPNERRQSGQQLSFDFIEDSPKESSTKDGSSVKKSS